MDRISRHGLRRLLEDAGTLTLEALSAAAYEAEHIPGAVNVPVALTPELAARIAPAPMGTVVVCCSGPR
jgi:rhodanese-related sulfurtransferase